MTEPNGHFQFDRAQSYWRHVPSGKGKHDTEAMAAMPDADLLALWDDAFRSRFRAYPEEDIFIRRFADSVRGQRILSVGSGLGFHELYYRAAGASLTCADIVPSNLRVIERVAALKGLTGVRTIVLGSEVLDPDFAIDTFFVYGALMHMPRATQRALLRNAARQLGPDGRTVLMLYTWTFVSATCGWSRPEQFDPVRFARASDPSVASEDCPWADWHDDAAILELAGEGFHLARKQTWNRDYYVWYELRRGAPRPVEPFFDAHHRDAGVTVSTIAGDLFDAGDATKRAAATFESGRNLMHYAALSPQVRLSERDGVNAVHISIELHSGAVSIGLLDTAQQRFVASVVVEAPGPSVARLIVDDPPSACQVIVSNHHPNEPGISRFTIRQVEFRAVPLAQPPVEVRR